MAALTYYNNIPTASQRLRDSQPQLLSNFASIETIIETNHIAFSDVDSGKHKFVQMPEQSVAPTTAANEMAVYTKQGAVSGVSALFVRDESNGTEVDFTSAIKSANGETTLPSGIKLKWGAGTTDGAGLQTVTFTNAFATIFSIQVSIATVGGNSSSSETYDRYARIYNYNTTLFSVVTFILKTSRARAENAYTWFAIGI